MSITNEELIGLNLDIEELYKIIDNCWDAIAIVDKSSKIVYVNNSFLMILGYPKEKILGTPFELFLLNKFQAPFEDTLKKVDSNTLQLFTKVVCKVKDGHEKSLHIGFTKVLEGELIVLHIKETHEMFVRSNENIKSEERVVDMRKDSTKKKDSGLFSWLDDANKALDSMLGGGKKQGGTKPAGGNKYVSKNSFALPEEIEHMPKDDIRESIKDDIDTFHSLGYATMSQEELVAAKEWHTWQVSIMLEMFKMNEKVLVADKAEIFPKFIREKSPHAQAQIIKGMVENYKHRASIRAKKEVLLKDAKWSAYEVGNLLYFLTE